MNTRTLFNAALLAALVSLAACGGDDAPPNPPGQPAVDSTPDAFTVKDVENAEPGEFHEASFTVTGIDEGVTLRANFVNRTAEAVFLVNGEVHNISSGAGVDVGNGDVVTAKVKASAEPGTTVGGKFILAREGVIASDQFDVTTKEDTEPPELAIHFPPMRATTNAPLPGKLIVRGSIDDEFEISKVTVNGTETTIDAETGNWTFEYALVTGIQTITVIAEDAAGKKTTREVVLEHVDTLAGYTLGIGDSWNPEHALAGALPDSPLIFAGGGDVYRLEPESGDRALLINKDLDSSDPLLRGPVDGLSILDESRVLLGISSDSDLGALEVFNHVTGLVKQISVQGDGKGSDTDFGSRALTVDRESAIAYMLSDADPVIWQVSLTDGSRSIISSDITWQTKDIDFDTTKNTVYLTECLVYALDRETGLRHERINPGDEDSCIERTEIDTETGAAFGFGYDAQDPVIFQLDFNENSATRIIDMSDAAFGPAFDTSFDADWSVDFQGNVGYLVQDGDTAHGDHFYAVDLETGYRVIISLKR